MWWCELGPCTHERDSSASSHTLLFFKVPVKEGVFTFLNYILFVLCVCVWRGGEALCMPRHVWRGKRSTCRGWIFNHPEGPRDETQVMRLGSRCLYLLGHLPGSKGLFLFLKRLYKLGIEMYNFNPSTWKAEACGSLGIGG